jgi:C2H2-type zinc finger
MEQPTLLTNLRGGKFQCAYPGCESTFRTGLQRRVHLLGGHGPRPLPPMRLAPQSNEAQQAPFRPLESSDILATGCEALYPASTYGLQMEDNPLSDTRATLVKRPPCVPKHPARFACPSCPKRFTRSSILRDHMRTHSGERPFPCAVCGLAFTRRNDCTAHERIHAGQRKFACGSAEPHRTWGCGQRFARAFNLHRHYIGKSGSKCVRSLDASLKGATLDTILARIAEFSSSEGTALGATNGSHDGIATFDASAWGIHADENPVQASSRSVELQPSTVSNLEFEAMMWRELALKDSTITGPIIETSLLPA